jgi:hypothetical protein
MSILSEHWKQLVGTVHPLDEPIFASASDHSFNLKFPPPAFVGHPDAPIVLLMANGGYKPGVTEAEFPAESDSAEHIAYLRGARTEVPTNLSGYYRRGAVGRLIAAGLAVSVNAVPYRSVALSKEPENKRVAALLPSLHVHRKWLLEEVLPAARVGQRYVLVHRNSWWQVPNTQAAAIEFSDPARAEPNRSAPDQARLDRAETWYLGGRSPISTS